MMCKVTSSSSWSRHVNNGILLSLSLSLSPITLSPLLSYSHTFSPYSLSLSFLCFPLFPSFAFSLSPSFTFSLSLRLFSLFPSLSLIHFLSLPPHSLSLSPSLSLSFPLFPSFAFSLSLIHFLSLSFSFSHHLSPHSSLPHSLSLSLPLSLFPFLSLIRFLSLPHSLFLSPSFSFSLSLSPFLSHTICSSRLSLFANSLDIQRTDESKKILLMTLSLLFHHFPTCIACLTDGLWDGR